VQTGGASNPGKKTAIQPEVRSNSGNLGVRSFNPFRKRQGEKKTAGCSKENARGDMERIGREKSLWIKK